VIPVSRPSPRSAPSTPFIIYSECDYFCAMNWLKNKRRISRQDLLEMLKRIDRAYGIVELNEREPTILETNRKERLFEVRSSKDKGKFYSVDADIKLCTCPDFNFRFLKCKHIIAAEFASGITS
jgi:hypothetical protein